MIEKGNKRLHAVEEQLKGKDMTIDQAESAVRRMQQMNDESRKKVLVAEVKIKQLTQATLKDLKNQLKERGSEVEVLKEMVKSSNIQSQSKDKDIQRLTKKLGQQSNERGRSDQPSSRSSRLSGGGHSPK